MFDLNQILNAALIAAVEQATKPLLERINALENAQPGQGWVDTLAARVGVMEQSLVIDKTRLDALDTKLEEMESDAFAMRNSIQALEDSKGMTAAAFVTYLDGEEWFWEKLSRKAGEVAQTVAEETLHDHTVEYEHDVYDGLSATLEEMGDLDDLVKREELRAEIEDVIGNARISIKL